MKPIKKAILPVAGFGTRFLPATKAQPKEMLPIFDTPAIQHIVAEAVEAGIEDIIVVTGRGKRAIEDHFDANFELEHALFEKKKMKELEMVQSISDMANFIYVRQPQPLGDGHALLCAQSLVEDDEAVVVLFGDDLVDNPGGSNAVQQLIDVYQATGESVVLLEKVPDERVSQYGIVDYTKVDKHHGTVSRFVEKPSLADAPSNLGVIGKYILTPNIWHKLRTTTPDIFRTTVQPNCWWTGFQANGTYDPKLGHGFFLLCLDGTPGVKIWVFINDFTIHGACRTQERGDAATDAERLIYFARNDPNFIFHSR